MRLVVRVERHHVGEDVSGGIVVPMLPPLELEVRRFGQVLFDRVVSPLDQHVVETNPLQEVSHSRRHTERVNGPAITARIR